MEQGATFAGPRVNAAQESRRGAAALQAGAYRDAKEAFTHVTELTPHDADAWYDLGQAASALGETRSAEYAYARSVALDPTSIESHRELAVVLAKMKQNQKATAQLDALKALAAACKDPCKETYELRGAISTVEDALSN
jgi:tetratricopeptide (TPR) repeat protein